MNALKELFFLNQVNSVKYYFICGKKINPHASFEYVTENT